MLLLLLSLHVRMLLMLALLFATLACWGLGGLFQERISSQYRAALILGEILMLMNMVFAGVLLLSGWQPIDRVLHGVYSMLAAFTLPAVWMYAQHWTVRARGLGWSAACIFICGILLRTIETGVGFKHGF